MLDKEITEKPKQSITVELELAVEGMTWDQMRDMERALRDVKVYANDTRICLSKKN